MKGHRADAERIVLELSRPERLLLENTLKLFPVGAAADQPLSRSADPAELIEERGMLREALAEHRAANQHRIAALLQDAGRFERGKGPLRLTLTNPEADWLLQVLNDIRVGSWRRLGCPEEPPEELTSESAVWAVAMEVCGGIQSVVLAALNQSPPS